jgi:hypothetical protein
MFTDFDPQNIFHEKACFKNLFCLKKNLYLTCLQAFQALTKYTILKIMMGIFFLEQVEEFSTGRSVSQTQESRSLPLGKRRVRYDIA